MAITNTRIRGSAQIIAGSINNAQISDVAGIETHKLAEGALLVKHNGTTAFTAPQTGVDPVSPNHLATKGYVDGVAQSLDIKASVKVATTGNITLSGAQVVDGITVGVTDRVLVKNQTNAAENGIYIVSAGVWSRSVDADSGAEVTSGMFTFVEQGTVNTNTGWALKTAGTITLNTTALEFTQFSGAGSFVSGSGLIRTGNQIDIVSTNGGIVVNPDSVSLTLADTSLEIVPTGLKLADLPAASILVGNAQNKATAVSMTGLVNVDGTGTTTINLSMGRVFVGDGTNKAVGVSLSGPLVIATNGTTSINLPTAKLFIGDATGKAQPVSISGELTVDQAGVASFTKTVFTSDRYVNRETPIGPIDGANTAFTLVNAPLLGTEMVFWNGMLLDEGLNNDYTIAGNIITLLFAPAVGEKVRVSYFK